MDAIGAHAQIVLPVGSSSGRKLAFLLPGFLNDLLQGADPTLRSALLQQVGPNVNLASLNSSVGTALSNLPVSSPASAVRFTLNSSGAYVPTLQSLGPILTERGETIGKNKFFFAVTYQRFQFDRLDDADFRNIHFRFPVSLQLGALGSVEGTLDSFTSVTLTASQTTAHFTYGVTHWMDASFALPIVTTSLSFATQGSFNLVANQPLVVIPQNSIHQSATGIGDGLVRAKAKLVERDGLTVAIASDVRIPTGDEFNYHGAGAYGIKPFLIASFTRRSVSPHLNAGYQWNGKSFLASATATEKQSLPGQLFYSAGAEASLSPRFTVAFDFLDQIIIHGRRTFVREQPATGDVLRTVYYPNLSHHELNGAAGFKAKVGKDVVLTGNLLFRLNESGLRSRVVPLVGLSYIF